MGYKELNERITMKYFEVEKEVLSGDIIVGTCASDGTVESFNCADPLDITLGFTVHVWNDEESFEDEWYPVKTDTSTSDYPNNEDDVLEQIKKDHPAGEWQNNNW